MLLVEATTVELTSTTRAANHPETTSGIYRKGMASIDIHAKLNGFPSQSDRATIRHHGTVPPPSCFGRESILGLADRIAILF